jgi:hypothetical protein
MRLTAVGRFAPDRRQTSRLNHTVVADSVNPLSITRTAWVQVAIRAGVGCQEVAIVCTDASEHGRRVEQRAPDIEAFSPPTWTDLISRDYEPWLDGPLTIDTSSVSVAPATSLITDALEQQRTRRG